MTLRITSRWEAAQACDHEISHLISIQNPDANLDQLRPPSIAAENHLLLLFHDVDDPDDEHGPKESHLRKLRDWVRDLDRDRLRGLLVHCDAGVSRSTASAWLAMVILEPGTPPRDLLERVAEGSGSTYCWPSDLVTSLGDRLLDRGGTLTQILRDWKTAQRNKKW